MENTKTTHLLFKGSGILYFWLYFVKSCKTSFFRKPKEVRTGCRTCYFFAISPFSKFQIAIVKILRKFYYVTNIFDLHIFDKETAAFLNFFEVCTEVHFVSLFFLNERNITTSLLMIHLKCTVAHYSNLNSSSVNKPFLNYGPLNMLFFRFLIYIYFNVAFAKKIMK